MTDKNDFIPVSVANTIRVTTRDESHQNQGEQKKKKEEEKKNIELQNKKSLEQLDTTELIEFGRIVLNKRNTELKLFTHQKNPENSNDLELLQLKIATYEKDIHELSLKPPPVITDIDLETQINNLVELFDLYTSLHEVVKEERKILNIDDIDFLEGIIIQKDDILNNCDLIRNQINFQILQELPDKNETKIKYEKILSEIRNTINDIIKYEDENSIELQNVRDKMKIMIVKQAKSSKTISQYSQNPTQAHFVDKKS